MWEKVSTSLFRLTSVVQKRPGQAGALEELYRETTISKCQYFRVEHRGVVFFAYMHAIICVYSR